MTNAQRAGAIAAAILVVGAGVYAGVRKFGARAPLAPAAPPETAWVSVTDTLRAGETLGGLLGRAGLKPADVARAITAAAPAVDERRSRAGMPVTTRRLPADSAPREVVFQLEIDHLVTVRRVNDSTWTGREERLPWRADTVVATGVIASNLYQALDDSASALFPKDVRQALAWSLADIYEYRIDMSRELQKGDRLRVLVEREVGPGGVVRLGPVLAARFTLSGAPMEAIRFADAAGRIEYYDADGRSLRAAFLRAPLSFRRVSSTFGVRLHPILHTRRKHEGLDYAADAGTPVRAIGDGMVVFAGRRGGYGNLIEVRHHNGMVSRYGHLRGFAAGVRAGRVVAIGQTIGYVGQTGLATGPHLHFELLVNGTQRDPRKALAHSESAEIPAATRDAFQRQRQAMVARLDAPAPASAPAR